MATRIGESGTEQFTITTKVDGKIIAERPIHDPFLTNRTVFAMSRWQLFKALFRKQFSVEVEVSVRGTEGMIRTIMMLDPKEIEKETQAILEECAKQRWNPSASGVYSSQEACTYEPWKP
jgi:hypothetical protein